VDKAVLSLRPRQPDAILEAFYGQRGLGVSTTSGLVISINRLLLEQMEKIGELLAGDTRALGMGGGGEVAEMAVEAPMGCPSAGAFR
jgi:hypothetical protein